MRKIMHILFSGWIIGFLTVASAGAQSLKSPSSPDNALVYFVRSNGTGALINFKYFDDTAFLGKFSGMNYMTYECSPGEHIFWVSSENRDYIKAELLAGHTYIIEVRPTMGAIKAAVRIFPVKPDDKIMKRINKLIARKEAIIPDTEAVEEGQEKLDFFISQGMERYKRLEAKEQSAIKVLEKSMFHL